MVLTHRRSSAGHHDRTVENVVLPADLLQPALSRRNPQEVRWSSIAGVSSGQDHFHAVRNVRAAQSSSMSTGTSSLIPPHFRELRTSHPVAPSARKLSTVEPTIQEHSKLRTVSTVEPTIQEHSKLRTVSHVSPDEQIGVAYALPSDRKTPTTVFTSLNDFSFRDEPSETDNSRRESRMSGPEPRAAPRASRVSVHGVHGPKDPVEPRRSVIPASIKQRIHSVQNSIRRTSVYHLYEKAKSRGKKVQRAPGVRRLFEYSMYFLALVVVYFVFIGIPLWKGAVYWLYWVVNHKFVIKGTWSIIIGLMTM